MNPLVSIIVPVFNVVEYLEKCVNSILSQTYTNFELIIVDDGSSDGSEILCDTLVAKDSRVRCMHKNNGGLSSARNTALDNCNGEYITFVDSDDIIAPNALEILVDCALDNCSDIVASDSYISFADVNLLPQKSFVKGNKTLDNIQALQDILCRNTRWEAWGHLFKTSLFENIRFPQGKIYEDLATIPYIVFKAKRITIIETAIYYYFQRPGSIMRQGENSVSKDLCYVVQDLLSSFIRLVKDKKSLPNICSGVLMELCSRTDFAAKNIDSNHEFIISARKMLRKHVNYVLHSNYYDIKKKIYYILEAFGFHDVIYWVHR